MIAIPSSFCRMRARASRRCGTYGEIVLITKGDLMHQESKLARSGLGELFDAVEIVSDKTAATYVRIFRGMAEMPG